jgi:hypothetical protein
MAMIFLSDEDRAGRRSVKVFSTIQGARTGRWCQAEAGAYPDRCDCILEDLTNGVATDFTIQYACPERSRRGTVNGRRVTYRHGHCEKCGPEYAHGRKLHPIPSR